MVFKQLLCFQTLQESSLLPMALYFEENACWSKLQLDAFTTDPLGSCNQMLLYGASHLTAVELWWQTAHCQRQQMLRCFIFQYVLHTSIFCFCFLVGWLVFVLFFFLVVCFFKINALLIQIYKMSLSKLSLFDIQLYICPASVRYKVGLLSSAAACSGKTYSVFIIPFIILPYSVLTLWIGVSPSKLSLVLARSVKSVDQLEFRTDDLLF